MSQKAFIYFSILASLTSTSVLAAGFKLTPLLEYDSTKENLPVLRAASQQVILKERDELKTILPSAEIAFAHVVNKTPYDVTVGGFTVSSCKSRFFSRAVDKAEPMAHIQVSAPDTSSDAAQGTFLPIHVGGYMMISGERNTFSMSRSIPTKVTLRTRDQMLEKWIPENGDYTSFLSNWSKHLSNPFLGQYTSPEDVDNWMLSLIDLPENTLFMYVSPLNLENEE